MTTESQNTSARGETAGVGTGDFVRLLREDADSWEGCGKVLGFLDAEDEKRNAERVATLRGAAAEMERLNAENKFLHDLIDGFEWQRINAMSAEEVRKELLAEGYTEERLNEGFAKVRAMTEAAAKREPNDYRSATRAEHGRRCGCG